MNNPLMGGMAQMGNIGNFQQMMQRFNSFRQQFQGDPREQVQQLLNSGKVSQQTYNQAYQMAQQLQKMMGSK